jgi:mutator protein MutT
MHETIPTVGVVLIRENRVLLVRKKNHPRQVLQLPGGQIEPGETLEEAAIRELYETTGLRGDVGQLVALPNEWHAVIEKSYGTKKFSFKCVLCRGYQGSAVETESATPVWVEWSKMKGLELAPNTQGAVDAASQLLV